MIRILGGNIVENKEQLTEELMENIKSRLNNSNFLKMYELVCTVRSGKDEIKRLKREVNFIWIACIILAGLFLTKMH